MDGYFIEDTPDNLLLKRDFKQCPIVIGFNSDEGTLFAADYFEGSKFAKDPPFANKEMFDEVCCFYLNQYVRYDLSKEN